MLWLIPLPVYFSIMPVPTVESEAKCTCITFNSALITLLHLCFKRESMSTLCYSSALTVIRDNLYVLLYIRKHAKLFIALYC